MIVSWVAANRSLDSATRLLEDASDRITGDQQISTDGFSGYERAVQKAFADRASHGAIQKKYDAAPDKGPERKYSPGICIAAEREVISDNPDEAMISTSHVERMNLNMRSRTRSAKEGEALSAKRNAKGNSHDKRDSKWRATLNRIMISRGEFKVYVVKAGEVAFCIDHHSGDGNAANFAKTAQLEGAVLLDCWSPAVQWWR